MTTIFEERLAAFLRAELKAETVLVRGAERMSGGYNRVMTRFTAVIDGHERRLVARGDPPAGQAIAETDSLAEWAVLSSLAGTSVPAPAAVACDPEGSRLGTRTIIMECVDGPGSLLQVLRSTDPSAFSDHAVGLAELMADVHAADIDRLPTVLDRPASWEARLDTLIGAWRDAEAEHVENDPFMRYVAAFLDAHRPAPAPLTLVHGELQPGNVVVRHTGELVAVDWEMVHIGDPREDIGWCMSLEAVQPPALVTAHLESFCARYRERTGLGADIVNPHSAVYFSILAGISGMRLVWRQQSAFARGETNSLRVAYLSSVLTTMHDGWMQAIEKMGASV